MIGNRSGDNSAGADKHIGTNADIPYQDHPSAQQHPISYPRPAGHCLLEAVPGDRHLVVDCAKFADVGGAGNHNILRVGQSDPSTNMGRAGNG